MIRYLLKSKFLFVLSLLLSFIGSLGTIYFAFVLGQIIETAVNGNLNILSSEVTKCIIVVVAGELIKYISEFCRIKALANSSSSLRKDFFDSAMKKNINLFLEKNTNEYASVLLNDIPLIESNYFTQIHNIFDSIALFLFGIVSMFYLNWIIAIAIIIASLIPIIVPQLFSGALEKKGEKYSAALEQFTVKIRDFFSGFEVIKSFNIVDKVTDDLTNTNKALAKARVAKDVATAKVSTVSALCGSIMFFVPVVLGSYLALKGMFYVGGIITAIQLINYILSPINVISNSIAQTNTAKPIANKILELMQNEKSGDTKLVQSNLEKFTDKIIFNNISFAYTAQDSTNENPLAPNAETRKQVLSNINLTIKKGEKVLIVGKTGSGKSTILKLLLKYFSDYAGEVLIDGNDVRQMNAETLYSQVGVIQQNVFLFHDTIENNIRFSLNTTNEVVDKAIEKAGLLPLIQKNPEGKQYNVGENGSRLSGGEKQRISIARCLLLDMPILVMDEVTSSLDAETAFAIESDILKLDKTVIAVSHRLNKNLLKTYDKIVVLRDGVIYEQGNYETLMNAKGMLYSMCLLDA